MTGNQKWLKFFFTTYLISVPNTNFVYYLPPQNSIYAWFFVTLLLHLSRIPESKSFTFLHTISLLEICYRCFFHTLERVYCFCLGQVLTDSPCTLSLFVWSVPRDPLANFADVVPQPIFGPSLSIGGQTAQWNGERTGVSGQVGVACRVIFDANVGDRVTSHLDICNDGTTAIYFSWKVLYALSF